MIIWVLIAAATGVVVMNGADNTKDKSLEQCQERLKRCREKSKELGKKIDAFQKEIDSKKESVLPPSPSPPKKP